MVMVMVVRVSVVKLRGKARALTLVSKFDRSASTLAVRVRSPIPQE